MIVSNIGINVPGWLLARVAELPTHLPDTDELMAVLNEFAARNVAEGTGGPFAAAVVETATGEVVSIGTNLVLSSNLSLAHAEIVALGLAQTRLGLWDLSGDGVHRTLVVNAQPCAMCGGAVVWSGIHGLDFAATGADVEALTGFDEGPVSSDWKEQLEARGISVQVGRGSEEACKVLRDFGRQAQSGEATLYNARS